MGKADKAVGATMEMDDSTPDYPRIIAGGAGVSLLGQILGNSSRLLFHVLLANLLGAASYGLFSIGLSFLNVLSIISLMGLNLGVVRHLAIYEISEDWSRLKGTIGISLFIVILSGSFLLVIMQVGAEPLAHRFFGKPALEITLKAFSWMLPFYSLMILISFIFRGLKKLKLTVLVREILQPLSALALLFLFYFLGLRGLVPNLAGYGFSILCGFIAGVILLKGQWKKYRGAKPIWTGWELLRFSLPLLLVHFLVLLLSRVDVMMLGYLKTSAETGIYAATFRVSQLLFIAWTAFNAIFGPLFAGLYHQGDSRELGRLFKMATRWVFSLTLPLVAFLWAFSGPVLEIFGAGFSTGSTALWMLSLMWLIISFSGSLGSILVMSGHQYMELGLAFAALIVNIGLNVWLIPPLGMSGAALATSASLILFNLVKMMVVYRLAGLHPFAALYARTLAPFGALVALLALFRLLSWGNSIAELVPAALLSMGLYLILLYRNGLTPGDKKVISSLLPAASKYRPGKERG